MTNNSFLQQVESSELVKEELSAALEEMGIETTKELDLVIQIKGEVRKLGTQSNIIDQLGALEQRYVTSATIAMEVNF